MLDFRDDDFLYRITGVDNGSSNLGMVEIDLDLRSGIYHLLDSRTIVADKVMGNQRGLMRTHSERYARQRTLMDCFANEIDWWRPDGIAVEDKFFMPKRVTSFEVLTEMMVMLREVVEDYRTGMNIDTITPGEAKRAVQTADFTMKKVVIRDCVLRLDCLEVSDTIDLRNDLTEHEYDAIAVAIAHGEKIRKALRFRR